MPTPSTTPDQRPHQWAAFFAHRWPATARTPAAAGTCLPTGRARLSYTRAEYLFKKATGATLHQLRHSRLTHLGEDGWSAPC